MMNRYKRQMALPEIDEQKQEKLMQSTIFMVGAGGLGSAALPYLAGAGIGHIIIADCDRVDISNLHRQTIYRADQTGKNKAECAADYVRALNPDIKVNTISERIDSKNISTLLHNKNIDLILDGSDNFETKSMLNDLSIKIRTPFIIASINQFNGQIGVFEGYKPEKACYRCLFADIPNNAPNYNEAGILGSAAGIMGVMQAHIALMKLLEIDNELSEAPEGYFIRIDLKSLNIEHFKVEKDMHCPYCCVADEIIENNEQVIIPSSKDDGIPVTTVNIDSLPYQNTIIIDVRKKEEYGASPLIHPLFENHEVINIPLQDLSQKLDRLSKNKHIAFICPKNIRSIKAARYLLGKGYKNIYVLNRSSFPEA